MVHRGVEASECAIRTHADKYSLPVPVSVDRHVGKEGKDAGFRKLDTTQESVNARMTGMARGAFALAVSTECLNEKTFELPEATPGSSSRGIYGQVAITSHECMTDQKQ